MFYKLLYIYNRFISQESHFTPQTYGTSGKHHRQTPPFGRWFARRITTYVAVCAFLTFVNWYTSPHYWWVVWVMAGWGLNLILSLVWYLTGCDKDKDYR